MSFLFASSHLPASRSLRPAIANEEEEEKHEDFQSMPRSGTVRAISHLPEEGPVRMEASAPQPTRKTNAPSWALGPETATLHDDEPPHALERPEAAAGFDDDHDEETESHEREDNRPWYLPSLTHKDLQANDHDRNENGAVGKDENTPPSRSGRPAFDSGDGDSGRGGLNDAPPENSNVNTPASRAPSSPPFPQKLKDTGRAPDHGAPTAPRGRWFEERSAPARVVTQQRMQDSRGTSPQEGRRASRRGIVAQSQRPAIPPKTAASPGHNRFAASQKNATSAAPGLAISADSANPYFEDAARAALADEAASSPVAAALQKEAARLGISIAPQGRLKMSETKLVNGKPVIYFNHARKTDTTMSHEIAHAIQMAVAEQVLEEVRKTGKIPDGNDIQRAIKAGRDALDKIVPVQSDKDQGQDYKENDAMRVAHVVGAERTATEMKDLPEEQKTLEEFLRRQAEKEKARGEPEKGRKHPNNDYPIPPGTERGRYDYQYVRDILGLDEKGQKKPKPLTPVQPLPSPQKPMQQPLPGPQPLL